MNVFKSKWFWIGLVILFLIVLTVDLAVMFLTIKNLFLGKLDPYLVMIGALSAVVGAIGSKDKVYESVYLRRIGLLFFIIALIWSFRDYGFRDTILLMIGVFIINKLVKWVLPKREKLRVIS